MITRFITRSVSVPAATIRCMADDQEMMTAAAAATADGALVSRAGFGRRGRWQSPPSCSPHARRAAGAGRAWPAGGTAGGGVADEPALAADPPGLCR